MELIEICLKGKCIAITGANGCFGHNMIRYLLTTQVASILAIVRRECDGMNLLNELSDNRIRYRPIELEKASMSAELFAGIDIVIHAAAMKGIAECEQNPEVAMLVNYNATKQLVHTAKEAGVKKLVLLSTDKATNDPKSIMGKTKQKAEQHLIACSSDENYRDIDLVVVRLGNVYDTPGSVAPTFRKLLMNNQDICVNGTAMVKFLLTQQQSVDLVLFALKCPSGSIVIQRAPAYSIFRLAEMMRQKYNKKSNIIIREIGNGETPSEVLLTADEACRAIICGDYAVSHASIPHHVAHAYVSANCNLVEDSVLETLI